MSMWNVHMKEKVKLFRSPAGGIKKPVDEQKFKGLTLANIRQRFINGQEHGWTKYPDVVIIIFYILNKFNSAEAAEDIGYKNASGSNTASSLIFRLQRLNMENFFETIRFLIKNSNLFNMKQVAELLEEPSRDHTGEGPGRKPWHGCCYKYFAKRIVAEAIHKRGTVAKAANSLRVSTDIINYWLDMEVPNILVEPGMTLEELRA